MNTTGATPLFFRHADAHIDLSNAQLGEARQYREMLADNLDDCLESVEQRRQNAEG